jgi:hypothetical protein
VLLICILILVVSATQAADNYEHNDCYHQVVEGKVLFPCSLVI